ncbi:MAG: hypothetical protein C0600_04435 [Ignavibacteria bacterium]|nr:MAG: hypothetical protein C0600_04435 [Ignavibacteria bacterium]
MMNGNHSSAGMHFYSKASATQSSSIIAYVDLSKFQADRNVNNSTGTDENASQNSSNSYTILRISPGAVTSGWGRIADG